MTGNDALNVNYPGNVIDFAGGKAQIAITTHGSDWYWAVTAVMMASTMAFVGLSYTKPRQERIFHYITAAITMVASIAYFSMASNIGWAPIRVEFQRSDPIVAGLNREIFYVRYIDWVITTPLLLMDLLLTAGLPWPTILYTILIDEIMIITGLVGALVRSSYKWGYFTFGCVALLWIGYVLIFEARASANRIGSDVGKTFLICGAWTFMLWTLYPIAFGVSEGGNVIAPDSEAVFYGVLDICAKPIFGALLLWGHRNIDPKRLGLHIRDYGSDDSYSEEKKIGSNGVSSTNGINGVSSTNADQIVTSSSANNAVADSSAHNAVTGSSTNNAAADTHGSTINNAASGTYGSSDMTSTGGAQQTSSTTYSVPQTETRYETYTTDGDGGFESTSRNHTTAQTTSQTYTS